MSHNLNKTAPKYSETPSPTAKNDNERPHDLDELEKILHPTLKPVGWIHAFVRQHGLVRTTIFYTICTIILSLGFTFVIFSLCNFPMRTLGIVVACVIPAIVAPLTFKTILRLFLDLDTAHEQHSREMVERMNVEHSLRKSEARFRAIFERSNDFILIHDFEGTLFLANPTAKENLDFKEKPIVGTSIFSIGQEKELRKLLEKVIKKGTNTFETTLRSPDGRQLVVTINSSVIDPKGRLIQTVVRDITEQKEAEKALLKAKEASEEANRLKSRFVFNVSHDIRTPLSGIIGYAEAILNETSIDRAQQHAWTILNESETLETLINDLLDLAKIEAGKMELDPAPLDLTSLASSAVSPLSSQARAKNLELKWSIQPGTPQFIRADAGRLRQILLNLLSNAVKFTEAGQVELTIAPMDMEDQSNRILFAVSDTGIGIEEDKQKAIFESFAQADATTTRKYGGTGLGTTIAQELVHLMGGEIGVFSVPKHGSTFWFNIPFETCPRESVAEETSTSGEWQRPSTHSSRILLAEDYPTTQAIAQLQLESAGHYVTIVENGQEALEASDQEVFDLIIMDLQMPLMDGQEATKLIRLYSKKNSNTPILAMTASAETSTREACIKAGMDDILIKPLRREELLKIVDQWLARDVRRKHHPRYLQDDREGQESPLDFSKALNQFANNESLLIKTLERFLRQTSDDLVALRKSLQDLDQEMVHKEAHKIKGAAAYLAARPLVQAATRLEECAKTRACSSTSFEALSAVERELFRLRSFIENKTKTND